MNSEPDICLICKNDDIKLMKLNCTHFYCRKCLKEWFKTKCHSDYKCCYCLKELKFREKLYFLNYFYYLKIVCIYILVFIYAILLLFFILLFFEKI